ncbi:MAG: pseudouridine synthase [Candidatus Hydrogenedentes bacterium]|nr:pseudouridine synthase [Candidatus Hydrogenedentota bacterium]
MMRLQQYLARCGVASRRACETLIAAGRIEVNGCVGELGQSIDPASDVVAYNGQRVQEERLVYILLNKAKDVVTSAADTHGRTTVLDCLHGVDARVFPVGRLDMDVQGALLLTNDGELAHRLMHPSYETPKVYVVTVCGQISLQTIAVLEHGVVLEDGPTAPAGVCVVRGDTHATTFRLTLHEGRKHEVKRMCDAVGHRVLELRRVSFAGLATRGLRPGEWRYLTGEEIASLRHIVGMTDA